MYWSWVKSPDFVAAQEPAISVTDYPLWPRFQLKWVRQHSFPLTAYRWKDDRFKIDLAKD